MPIYNSNGKGITGVYETVDDACIQNLKISGQQLTITDGNTVTLPSSGGGTWGSITGTLSDQTDLQAAIDAAPSGTGTNLRIPVWTGTNSLGSSTLLQSATGQTLDANLAFQITGGTTASRPTGAAGMMYWNTSNGWLDIHNGTSWFNPLRSATATGLGTSTYVGYFHTDGTLTGSPNFVFSGGKVGIGVAPSATLTVQGSDQTPASFASSFAGNMQVNWNSNLGYNVNFVFLKAGVPKWYIGNIAANDRFYIFDTAERFTILQGGDTGIGTGSPDRRLHSELSDAVTNAIVFPLRLTHTTSGTATTSFGVGQEFELENASGTNRVAATQSVAWSDAADATEDAAYILQLMRAGSLATALSVSSIGQLTSPHSITMQAGDFTVASGSSIIFGSRGTFDFTNEGVARLQDSGDFNRLQFGGTSSSFPSLQRSSAGLVARLADDSANTSITASNVISTGVVRLQGYTVATLPTGVAGNLCYVTDALTPAYGSTIVGGGAVVTKVWYNGTNYIVG